MSDLVRKDTVNGKLQIVTKAIRKMRGHKEQSGWGGGRSVRICVICVSRYGEERGPTM